MSRFAFGSGALGSKPLRLRFLFLLATIFGATIILLSYRGYSNVLLLNNLAIISSLDPFSYDAIDQGIFTIRTEGCSIPGLQPLDASIKRFVKYPDTIKPCRNAATPFLDNNRTHIWIVKESYKYYNVSNKSTFKCCYRSFYRPLSVKDITSSNIDDRVQYRKCKHFIDTIEASDEFVHVVCYEKVKLIYQQYFLFAVTKEPSAHNIVDVTKNKTTYNVLILGIDAVSRLNFYRTMPKTLNFLKEKDAIELLGYNKVGDNTFPNLVPMLMGIRESDLKRTCIPNPRHTFDNCPFLWEWYKQAGFYTALGEDSSSLGTFNYFKVGFARSPTDYYIHTFINEAERNVGNNKDFNSFLCMNNKYFYAVLLDYIENLLMKLRSSKVFGFFWEVTMSHDHLNYPMLIDHYYENFFKRIDALKILENTFIFLVSDHGIRWGAIRATKQGRLEERLPFVNILVPQSFKENYNDAYSNLQLNQRRLTTPFNIHATLNDLIDLKEITDSNIHSRSQTAYGNDRSISLFLPIPSNRTCSMADIDDHWCTCHRERKLSIESTEVSDGAAHIVEELNNLVHDYKVCSKLSLVDIIDATEMEVGTAEKDEISWREFMIVVHTNPGGGVFESTIRHDGQRWILIGTISRLNLYGHQSHCVNNYHLKLYCYCL